MPKYRVIIEIEHDYGEEGTPEEVLQEFVWSVSDLLLDFGCDPRSCIISAVEEEIFWHDISVYKLRQDQE